MINALNKPTTVADDLVVSLDFTLTVDDEVVDTTEGDEPIQFLQGNGNIIPGLERQLYGMKTGESKQVIVSAEEGYGPVDPESIESVPRSEFPHGIPLKPGVELEMKDKEGDTLFARIISVGRRNVKLDFNHPFAGKSLYFDITVVDLRPAPVEELEHEHVHEEDEEH